MTSLKILGKLDESFFAAWSSPVLYRIQSDYEDFSSLQICRYLMKESIALAYPICKAPYFFSSVLLTVEQLRNMESRLRLQARKAAQLDNWTSVCFAPQQAVSFWLMHILLGNKFELVSLDSLESLSVLCRGQGDLHDESFAVTIERCTVSADGKCTLNLKVNVVRMKSLDFPARRNETVDGNATCRNCMEGVLLFSGEQVVVREINRLPAHSNAKGSAVLPAANESLLQQGFGSFYPNNVAQFLYYWDLIAGWKAIPNDKHIQAIRAFDGARERIIPADLITRFLIVSPKSANDALARVEPALSEALQSVTVLQDVQFQHEQAHVQFETSEQPTRFLRASALRSNKSTLTKDGDSKTTPDEGIRDADRNQVEPTSSTGKKRSASHMSSSVAQPTNTSRTLPSSKARVAKQEAPSRFFEFVRPLTTTNRKKSIASRRNLPHRSRYIKM